MKRTVWEFIDWERIMGRPDLRAYLAAFDAYVAAGGTTAPDFVAGLLETAFMEIGQ